MLTFSTASRCIARVAIAAIAVVATLPAVAAVMPIRPLVLGDGLTLSGTITTDGTVGALSAGNFTGWDLSVTQVTTTTFTRANSSVLTLDGVSAAGGHLTVANPDGSLGFYKGPAIDPTMVQIADFTGAMGLAGQALFASPFEFQQVELPALDPAYTVANQGPGNLFNLIPIDLGSGYVVTGSLTTSGSGLLSLADLVDWDLVVTHTELLDRFDPTNSSVTAEQVTSDGSRVLVGNPDGYLAIAKPGVRHPPTALLADFTDPSVPGGRGGYFSPFMFAEVSPLTSSSGQYAAAGEGLGPVPVPEPAPLLLIGMAVVAFVRVRTSG